MNKFSTYQYSLLKLNLLAAAVLSAGAVQAADGVVWYSEVNGGFAANLFNGTLTGGPLAGQTVQANLAQYRGADNLYLGFANNDGSMSYYAALNGAYIGFSSVVNLTPGTGGVSGTVANNLAFFGLDDNSLAWYMGPGGTLRAYDDYSLGTVNLFGMPTNTAFSGGSLNGVAISQGVGLKVAGGGGTDINQQYMMNVAGDGTLDHYYLGTFFGNAGQFVDFAGHGGWTTFNSGPLSGLTLTQLAANATGTVGSTTYRFLGTSGDAMYFDVTTVPVPEPATYAMWVVGLAALGLMKARRPA